MLSDFMQSVIMPNAVAPIYSIDSQ
jgi:hypothetical protein